MKTQSIRLADVFIIGPAMIYGGYRLQQRDPNAVGVGLLLMAAGVGTVLYNYDNYQRARLT